MCGSVCLKTAELTFPGLVRMVRAGDIFHFADYSGALDETRGIPAAGNSNNICRRGPVRANSDINLHRPGFHLFTAIEDQRAKRRQIGDFEKDNNLIIEGGMPLHK